MSNSFTTYLQIYSYIKSIYNSKLDLGFAILQLLFPQEGDNM